MKSARDLWRYAPVMAVVATLILLLAGAAGAWFSQSDFQQQKIRQAEAHARVLAASVSAALAFNDPEEAARAVAAVSADPDVTAVGVYARDGALFVQNAPGADQPPAQLASLVHSQYRAGFATATMPVSREGAELGWVYVRLSAGSGAARWMRYIGVFLLLAMAAVAVGAIAVAQRSLSAAHEELGRRAEQMERTNAELQAEATERKKAQAALLQGQKMEAVGQLVGGVAHDFNNLLMVVSSGLRLLEKRTDEEQRATIVAAMRSSIERGAGLTRQLLAFSRRQNLSPQVLLVHERLLALRPLIERSIREDIALDFRIEDRAAFAKVDAAQFDIAILNLAVNARDAMPNGGRLSIRVGSRGGDVAISVADTGQGMSPEVQARAFDPYFTTKPVGQGTGLGLSQVYGFVVQSGGNCEIESVVGQGTTVTLLLPRTEESADAPGDAGQRAATSESGCAVLVVEDDDNVAAMVCEMMRELGHAATRVSSAKEALERLDSGQSFDVVFSDIIMPGGMSGVDLAVELKRTRPELPVLLTTGYGGAGEDQAHGFTVLRKPYERQELVSALAACCSRMPVKRSAAEARVSQPPAASMKLGLADNDEDA